MASTETSLYPRRWWALGALLLANVVLGFDLTILNVALPAMAAQLGASISQQQWFVDAFIVVLAAMMLPAGLLGDRFGRRRMLLVGLGIFLAGAVIGSLVHTPDMVIVARTVMGLGAALIMPLAVSVLPSLFGRDERSRAVAAIAAATALGMPLGPLLGGLLLNHFWWGSIFVVNIPLVALAMLASAILIPDTRDESRPRLDPVSAVLAVVGLGALVYGIIEAPRRGWGSSVVVVALVGAVILIAGLVLHERRAAHPILDLSLLGRPAFAWSTAAATFATFALTGMLFILPPYLQTVLGNDAFGTGIRLLPMMGGLVVAARMSGRVMSRTGAKPVITLGLAILGIAMLLGGMIKAQDTYADNVLWMTLAGFGFGLVIVPSMDGALGELPRERAGSGSGLLMTLRQSGSALGVALLGSLLAAAFGNRLDTSGLPPSAASLAHNSVVAAHTVAARLGDPALTASANSAYVHGMAIVLLVCGAAALVAAAVVLVFLPGVRPARQRAAAATERATAAADAVDPAQ